MGKIGGVYTASITIMAIGFSMAITMGTAKEIYNVTVKRMGKPLLSLLCAWPDETRKPLLWTSTYGSIQAFLWE
jgi:hypothetical protein